MAIERTKGQTLVDVENMEQQIAISKVSAQANATQTISTAQANSLLQALTIESQMCTNIKSIMGVSSTAFLLSFIWTRLLENKILKGIQAFITMALPTF
jgi:hypothetical protein